MKTTKTLLKNIQIVNKDEIITGDILIEGELISKIGQIDADQHTQLIDGTGKYVFPGVIDGQVHFRDPGFTHKADLYTESKAAVAGGVTSFIDMPNTSPNVLDMRQLDYKYDLASRKSLANFGFFLGVNGDNIDAVVKLDTSGLLAVSDDGLYFTKKGNLIADQPEMMEKLFSKCSSIIAIHSEKEEVVEENEALYRQNYGEDVPVKFHPYIRSEKACFEATQRAIELAKKHKARLHILHLTTEAETHLFTNKVPLKDKKITTEVCVQHLWFSEKDYDRLGKLIKWNPAIKTKKDSNGLFQALLDDKIDLITTDHAPHRLEEKQQPYFQSMSGAPMVQHGFTIMLEFYKRGRISLEKIAEKMCHNPAALYNIDKRGFIKEGNYADLVIVDMDKKWTVNSDTILYKCGWSPLEGETFSTKISHTFVNGNLVYNEGVFDERFRGKALEVKK